jgi:hypothetical protein
MGHAGRDFVVRNYNWADNAALMERLYDSMLEREPAANS